MKRFLQRHADKIVAVLCGFDRLVFRGTLLRLVQPGGMFHFLNAAGVRLLDFKHYVQATSEGVKRAALREAVDLDRPVRYIQRPSVSKEEYARLLLREHPVQQGLICAFTAVEPCMSFEYHRSQDHAERGLRLRPRKCLHVYKYWLHPTWGFMSARVQTWFPFNVQVCLNGREWLARDFQRADHTDFLRDDNCFTRLGDPALAQACMDRQLSTPWPAALDAVAAALNPLHAQVFEPRPMSYDWSAYQTEWATDVLFRDPRSLAEVYPALVAHATRHFQSPDVLRFLGRKAHGNFTGELTGSFKQRPEGVRVKHWLSGNSVKMYDKGGSVLRVETTIANPVDFKVFRPLQDDDGGRLDWRPLRKGVADLHRRAEVSQRSNERYLDALAADDDSTPLHRLLDAVSRPAACHGRRVRAIRTGDPNDVALLQAISRGEFATAGFRNRDLRRLLFPNSDGLAKDQTRRLSAKISRMLRLLRAHGVVQKVQKSHRYRLTAAGELLTAALNAARHATVKQLLQAVA